MTEPVNQQQETVTRQKNPLRIAGGLSLFALAIGSYLLYNKFKKLERKLIDIAPPPMVKTNTEPKRDIFEML